MLIGPGDIGTVQAQLQQSVGRDDGGGGGKGQGKGRDRRKKKRRGGQQQSGQVPVEPNVPRLEGKGPNGVTLQNIGKGPRLNDQTHPSTLIHQNLCDLFGSRLPLADLRHGHAGSGRTARAGRSAGRGLMG